MDQLLTLQKNISTYVYIYMTTDLALSYLNNLTSPMLPGVFLVCLKQGTYQIVLSTFGSKECLEQGK